MKQLETEKTKFLIQFNFLEELITGLNTQQIHWKDSEKKWSIFENIAHLGRYQQIFLERVHRVLEEEEPHLERYIADNDHLFFEWTQKSFPELISQMKKEREVLQSKILSLTQVELKRIGIHPKLGKLKITDWVAFFLLHENHHIYRVFWLIHEQKEGNHL